MKKIAFYINNLKAGGTQVLISNLVVNLNKKCEYKLDIVVNNISSGNLYNFLEENNIKIINLDQKNEKNPLILFKIFKIFKNYDLVHVNLFPNFYWFYIFKIFNPDIKFVFTEHSTYNNRRKIKILKYLEKKIYSKMDFIICISNNVKENLVNWIGNKKIKKLKVIENGIKLQQKETIKELKNKRKYKIAMVARFTEEKDQLTLIKAVQNLNSNKYLLYFIGEGNKEYIYKNYVIENGLENKVFFLGYQKNIFSLLKNFDLFVLSSNWEGFGLSAIEAMSIGLPTIVSKVEGLKDITKGGALIFPPKDYKVLSKLISLILNDKDLYRTMSYKAIEISKNYDIETVVRKHLEIYKYLLGE